MLRSTFVCARFSRAVSVPGEQGGRQGLFFLVDGSFFYLGVPLFPDSAISPPKLMSCSLHTEACNELGTTD